MKSIGSAALAAVASVMPVCCMQAADRALLAEPPEPEVFRAYWYHRGAEISRFDLVQSRYGETHRGHAVHVFVTEPMDPVKQVKPDRLSGADLPVLKLNALRSFYTGIYPYSIMTSVFAPVDVAAHPLPPKTTASLQEWCGQTFLQLNLAGKQYRVRGFSYFESEGDVDARVPAALPEAALWTRLRLAPRRLPVGTFKLLRGAVHARFRRLPVETVEAVGRLEAPDGRSLEGKPLAAYKVTYASGERWLKITFERSFPHRIQGWEDSDGTLAVRTHTIMTDYWNHNGSDDRHWLRKLGLEDHAGPGR